MIGWIILFIPTAVIIIYISFVVDNTSVLSRTKTHNGANTSMVISVSALLLLGLIFVCSHVRIINFMEKYEAVSIEYKIRIDTFDKYERAALFSHAVDLTAEAAVYRFWDKYFDPFVPDSIHELKPIR